MRVAVAQFATSLSPQENLATCCRVINEVASCKPSVIVLPEYCNTHFFNGLAAELDTELSNNTCIYADHNQAWHEAVSVKGEFLQTIAELAQKHDCYIVLNVTMRRDDEREHQDGSVRSDITVTSCAISPLGELIHQKNKQNLTPLEQQFFVSTRNTPTMFGAVGTPHGQIGLLNGSDTMTFEASRSLAFSGAQLFCNSLSTVTVDQVNLHDAARASENNAFMATASKIGSLTPDEIADSSFLIGVGKSQIISPQGDVIAQLADDKEGFIFADIDITESKAGISRKYRPDGTQFVYQRRPELYQHKDEAPLIDDNTAPTTANVAIFATYKSNEEAINDVCHYIENNLSDIIQLPELFFVSDKSITQESEQRGQITALSQLAIEQVSAVLRPFQYVCTSLIIDDIHQAVIISDKGVFANQAQLHECERYKWTKLGDKLNVIKLVLEQGSFNLAMLTADDVNMPEIVKVASRHNTHLLLAPIDIQESSEVESCLLSRAVENKLCLVAASREKSFANTAYQPNDENNIYAKNKAKVQKSTGLIINLVTESGLLPQWKSSQFNGYLSEPLVKHQFGKITKAVIHPIAAGNKG